jgi:hypothetical protein
MHIDHEVMKKGFGGSFWKSSSVCERIVLYNCILMANQIIQRSKKEIMVLVVK